MPCCACLGATFLPSAGIDGISLRVVTGVPCCDPNLHLQNGEVPTPYFRGTVCSQEKNGCCLSV